MAFAFLPLLAIAIPQMSASNQIWFTEPAKQFTESCPLGNGRLGAMIFGDPHHERVVLNESTMWSGSPQDADRSEAYKVLPEIRRLLVAGENRRAQELLQANFTCKPPGVGEGKNAPYGCYQVFGNLAIDQPGGAVSDYKRVLDLEQAVARVDYSQNGTDFHREAFASAPGQLFVYRITADKPGQVSLSLGLSRPEAATCLADGEDLVLRGQLDSGNPAFQGVRFEGRVRVIAKHTTLSGNRIVVDHADEAIILFSAGTDLADPDYAEHAKRRLLAASKQSYNALKRASIRDYQRFYHRAAIDLPQGPSADLPTVKRLIAAQQGEDDPSLAGLYFNYGRYLLIGSSRPDSPLPANLQGIWAEETQTPWNGDFHLDINVQMNYWPAEICNLGDCHQPLLRFIPKLVENGRKTAKAYYGARGWVAHVVTNPWCFTAPGDSASWGSTCSGGGWLCEHLWEHYAFGHDKAYLASIYPVVKEASEFFLDMLIAEPKHGWLVTAPSNSPENAYVDPKGSGGLSTCMGPTMDIEIVRELFTNTIAAAQELGIDAEMRDELTQTRAKLAPLQIGKYGQLQEWLEDYEETDIHHRHTSHLYGLHPSNQISPDKTPDLAAAARKTLERRGDVGTGWSLAWKVCFWADLWDGDHAWLLLKRLFQPVGVMGYDYHNGGGTYPNLFDAHPPFQIDGNFGATDGIAEMLLQSQDGVVHLLPALPRAWASHGSVRGLRARGNITVDFDWREGKVTSYKLSGPGAKGAKVIFGGPKG